MEQRRNDHQIEASIVDEMGISEDEFDRRKEWLEFHGPDEKNLEALNAFAEKHAEVLIEKLYEHFLSFNETATFFQDPEVLERVKKEQKAYFKRLTEGDYHISYMRDRLKIGAVHERIDLKPKWYLGAYAFYIRQMSEHLFEAYDDPERALELLNSWQKLVFLDIGLAIDAYIWRRERTIRLQQEAIRELSTPVLQVKEGLLILPIVGVIDSRRAEQITETVLNGIRERRAKIVVIDITGVPTVDSQVANHLVQTVDASRLMGADVILTGIAPDIAQTLVRIGAELQKVRTVGDLQGGLEEALQRLGRMEAIRAKDGEPQEG